MPKDSMVLISSLCVHVFSLGIIYSAYNLSSNIFIKMYGLIFKLFTSNTSLKYKS